MRREIYSIAAHSRETDRGDSKLSLLSLSTHARDNKETWQDFRRELTRKGFESESLNRHSYVFKPIYMLKLNESGLLDQGPLQCLGNSHDDPWWNRRMHIDTVHSREDVKLPVVSDEFDVSRSIENESCVGLHIEVHVINTRRRRL